MILPLLAIARHAENGLPSSGTATFLTAVKVRSGPSTSSKQVALYQKGETVNYDKLVKGDGRTWISYIGASGNRRYCCAIDKDGSHYISAGPTPPTPKPSGRTGVPGIPVQGSFSQRGIAISGCCFLAACVKGGCTTKAQCVNCWNWAVKNGLVRKSDAYVLAGAETLAKKCASHFGLTYHSNYQIIWNCTHTHFYIFVNGKEFFNSAGLGYHVC